MNHSQTLFSAPQFFVYDGDNTVDGGSVPIICRVNDRLDTVSYRSDHAVLSPSDTYSLQPALFGTSEWLYSVVRVVGNIEVRTAGTGVTGGSITGATRCYGTSLFPGFFVLSGKKLTSAVIYAAAASTVDILSCIATTPDDARLL